MPRQTRYRGKRRLAKVLASIGITVLVVSALLGTAYLFLRDYVSVTDDGILLSLPFWSGRVFNRSAPLSEPSPSPTPENGGITVVIENTPSFSLSPEPSELPESGFRAVFLPQSALADSAEIENIAALCDSGAINAVVIEVKSSDGVMATKSSLQKAMDALSGKAQLVAYMSMLHDNTITRQESKFGIKHKSGVNWLDSNSSRWINPFVPEARLWLAEQAAAVAELPFGAFLFDTLWFPPSGQLDAISWGQYAEESRSEALETLANDLRAAVSVPCWAVIQPENGEVPAGMYDRLFARISSDRIADDIIPIILPLKGSADEIRTVLEDFDSYLLEGGCYPAEAFTK